MPPYSRQTWTRDSRLHCVFFRANPRWNVSFNVQSHRTSKLGTGKHTFEFILSKFYRWTFEKSPTNLWNSLFWPRILTFKTPYSRTVGLFRLVWHLLVLICGSHTEHKLPRACTQRCNFLPNLSTLSGRRMPHRKWIRGQHWAALASAAKCCPLFHFQYGILRQPRVDMAGHKCWSRSMQFPQNSEGLSDVRPTTDLRAVGKHLGFHRWKWELITTLSEG